MNHDQIQSLIDTHGLHHGGMHDFAVAVADAARAELSGVVAVILKAEVDLCDMFLDQFSSDPFMDFDCGRVRGKRSVIRKLIKSIGHQLPPAETLEFQRQCGEP